MIYIYIISIHYQKRIVKKIEMKNTIKILHHTTIMEPTTSEWIAAFKELERHPELSQLVLHRQGVWSFVAERHGEQAQRQGKGIAHTYYKSKIYNTVTYCW